MNESRSNPGLAIAAIIMVVAAALAVLLMIGVHPTPDFGKHRFISGAQPTGDLSEIQQFYIQAEALLPVSNGLPDGYTLENCQNTYTLHFDFTARPSQDHGGYEFLVPLTDRDHATILNEYPDTADTLLAIAGHNGVGILGIFDNSVVITEAPEWDPDALNSDIQRIINTHG